MKNMLKLFKKRLVLVSCSLVVVAFVAIALGMITPDQVMETLTIKTWELQRFGCERLTVKVIASATDGGWGKDVVTAHIYDKKEKLLAKSFVITSFARAEQAYKKFVFKTNKDCTLIVMEDAEASKAALMVYDDETREIWPFHDGQGGNERERANKLKEKLIEKAKEKLNIDYK